MLTSSESQQVHEANRASQAPTGPALRDVFDDYQTRRDVTENVGYNERRRFEKHLRERPLFNTPIDQLDDRHGQSLIKDMELGKLPPTVIEETQKTLRQMGKFLHETGQRGGTPLFQHLRVKKQRTTKDDQRKPLPLDDYLAVQGCEDVSDDDRDGIGLGFTVGSRKSTLLHMPWSDIDMMGGYIIERFGLEGGPTKSGEPHTKPMTPAARDILQRRIDRLHGGVKPESGLIFPNPETGKAFARGYDFHFKANLKLAGVDRPDLSFHSTRHGCAVALLSGMMGPAWSMEAVQVYLGHSSIRTTQRYAKFVPGALKQLAELTTLSNSIDDGSQHPTISGAGNEIRTHDFNLGKVALYR